MKQRSGRSAIEWWREQVRVHNAQSVRARGEQERGDFWQTYAPQFHDDPFRKGDPVVDRLLHDVTPQSTVLDVGGGAGRFALPLALRCSHVTVVEPSPSMLATLHATAQHAGVQNIASIPASWEEATVQPHDIVLCAHVLYGVEDVEPFIRKLNAHARERVDILSYMESPQAYLAPLWQRVRQEERVNLPGARELLPVLWEMDIYPNVEMMLVSEPRAFETLGAARQEFQCRLYISPGSPENARLEEAVADLLVEAPDGLRLRYDTPRHLALLWWPAY